MKLSYLKLATVLSVFAFFPVSATIIKSKHPEVSNLSRVENQISDSLKAENLEKELKKLKPLGVKEFEAKFTKELNGFKLTDVQAYQDKQQGSSAYANYQNGEKTIYLMVTDGAGGGSERIKENLISYLEMKKTEEPEDKTKILNYKGWMVYFDESMFEGDGMTAIHYLEGNRYSVIASGNGIPLAELKSFLDKFSL